MNRSFEDYLIESFEEERDVRFCNLKEWRGYNLDFMWMVDDLYAMLTDEKTKWIKVDNIKYFHTENFMFRKVCFLGRISLSVTVYTNQVNNSIGLSQANSEFATLRVFQDRVGFTHDYNPSTDSNVNPDNILFDECGIIIKLNSKTTELPEYEFRSACWHEIMHLYQVYQEYLKNRNKLPKGVLKTNFAYSNIIDKIQEYGGKGDSEVIQVLRTLYKLDPNEINANLSMIFPFIQKNFLVSHYNIMEYLPQLDIYKNIELAKSTKEMMERILSNKESKEKIDSLLYSIFSKKCEEYKKEDCSKLFLKHLIRMIPYMQSKMYRNAKSALEALKRPTYLNELDARLSRL